MKDYQRLGDYIREVNVHNRELKVTNLMGISMTKKFRPSTSNVVGTDLSNYKIVSKNIFVFDTMSVIRVHKVPIAINNTDEPIIVSPAYHTFEVIDKNTLMPEYLMMWFRRPEFDRYADFKSDSAIRGGYGWDELCDTIIDVPSLARQREIVSEYETLTRRIRLNEQMIAKLEETAQALYRKMFVEGVDKENLPEGWRRGTFTEIARLSGGGTPDTNNSEYWGRDIPFFTPADSTKIYCIKTDKMLTELGFDNCSSKLYKKNTTFVTARGTVGEVSLAGCNMAMNQSCYALLPKNCDAPLFIHQFAINTVNKLKEEAVGAVFNALVTKDFETTEVIVPPINKMIEYNSYVESVYGMALTIQQENAKLTELQSLLLARMGK